MRAFRLGRYAFAAAALAVCAGLVDRAEAMSLSPIHIEMTTVGVAARSQIVVTNPSTAPLQVELDLKNLALDDVGTPRLTPANDEFLIFPPQATIAAGGTQVFRIQWLGEPDMAKSRSFVLSVNQVPVKQLAGQKAVQIVMSLGAMINVAPVAGQAELRVIQSGVVTGKNGKRYPTLTVENPSKVHALLPRSTLALSSGSWSQTLTPSELDQLVGIGLVEPMKRRRFTLPIELPAHVQSVQTALDYKPNRR
jgi:fimbrial chaperone protein